MNIISQTPAITAGAYSAGDAVGGKLTFTGCPDDGLIHGCTIIDKSEAGIELDLILFEADFTAIADNDAFDITAGDEGDIIGVINFAAADFKDMGGLDVCTVKNISLPYELTDNTVGKEGRIYGQLVTRGTPTYGSTSDIIVKLAVLPYRG